MKIETEEEKKRKREETDGHNEKQGNEPVTLPERQIGMRRRNSLSVDDPRRR